MITPFLKVDEEMEEELEEGNRDIAEEEIAEYVAYSSDEDDDGIPDEDLS